jgi:hypothetical protein
VPRRRLGVHPLERPARTGVTRRRSHSWRGFASGSETPPTGELGRGGACRGPEPGPPLGPPSESSLEGAGRARTSGRSTTPTTMTRASSPGTSIPPICDAPGIRKEYRDGAVVAVSVAATRVHSAVPARRGPVLCAHRLEMILRRFREIAGALLGRRLVRRGEVRVPAAQPVRFGT